MNQHTIQPLISKITRLEIPQEDLRVWLTTQATSYHLRWLLAHTDSGVIWGEMRDDHRLHLSCEAFPAVFEYVALDWVTLQQCRLFGESGELLLWQGMHGWQARLRQDEGKGETNATYFYDEAQVLWGNIQKGEQDGFCLLAEGSQGIVHAPPLKNIPTQKERASLLVRHYITKESETGMLRITASRLVSVQEPSPCNCPTKSHAKKGKTQ
jgi:CRISPR-associated protein (TIGR03984 family)